MELIKKIKGAEGQAREIVELAKSEIAKESEAFEEHQAVSLAQAEQERKEVIESAISAAEAEGAAEVEELKKQAEDKQNQLRESVSGKMAGATSKVMDYLKG